MKIPTGFKVQVMGSSGKAYTVMLTDKGKYKCSCPHWIYHCQSTGVNCKHIEKAIAGKMFDHAVPAMPKVSLVAHVDRKFSVMEVKQVLRRIAPCLIRFTKGYEVCGSYRRGKKMIGDIDIIADCDVVSWARINDRLTAMGERLQGAERQMRFVIDNIQVDVARMGKEHWGNALCHYTGSFEENKRLRIVASDKGWTLSQYGFLQIGNTSVRKCFKTEQEVYKFLGEKYVEPRNR